MIGTGTKKAPYWMPFWYRTMCEELFCISILIHQDEDCNNKNNLLNIVKNWRPKKGRVYKHDHSVKLKAIKKAPSVMTETVSYTHLTLPTKA